MGNLNNKSNFMILWMKKPIYNEKTVIIEDLKNTSNPVIRLYELFKEKKDFFCHLDEIQNILHDIYAKVFLPKYLPLPVYEETKNMNKNFPKNVKDPKTLLEILEKSFGSIFSEKLNSF